MKTKNAICNIKAGKPKIITKIILLTVNAGKKKKKWIWISSVLAAALLMICTFITFLVIKKQKYGFKGTEILTK